MVHEPHLALFHAQRHLGVLMSLNVALHLIKRYFNPDVAAAIMRLLHARLQPFTNANINVSNGQVV